MKVCYVDETGNTAQDPCLVMVGILVDAHRLNRTREEFAGIFDEIQALFEENLRELKGSKMILGRDRWRKVDPELRKRIAGYLCTWIVGVPKACRDEWLAGGLHIALQLQKANQAKDKNKGHTFLIFDDNKAKADALSDLLFQPPEWTDDYYDKGKKQARLDQIVDTTFSIKSHHAGLVQVADLFAFMFRRYAEMTDFGKPEEWAGEQALIDGYVDTLSERLLPRACRWPTRQAGASPRWFNSIAPASLQALGK